MMGAVATFRRSRCDIFFLRFFKKVKKNAIRIVTTRQRFKWIEIALCELICVKVAAKMRVRGMTLVNANFKSWK